LPPKGTDKFIGLDLRSDARSLEPGSLTVAENVVTRKGTLHTRPGYVKVVQELGTPVEVLGLETYVPVTGDRSIVIVRRDGIFLYEESA